MPVDYDINVAHCSNHSSFYSGCGDCAVSHLFQLTSESKMQKVERVGVHSLEILPGQPGPKLQLVRQQLARKLHIFLTNAASDVSKTLENSLHKASDDEKITEELFIAAFASIAWLELVDAITSDLYEALKIGVADGLAQLEIASVKMQQSADELATKYATMRSAEMIGKKWVDGKLADNPNARYVVSDTTRDDLKDIIQLAAEKNMSLDKLKKEIQTAGTFSKARAELIAKTEIAMAQVKGNLYIWKQSGKVKSVSLITSHDHSLRDECDETKARGPFLIEKAPFVPIHPRCECGLEVYELNEG